MSTMFAGLSGIQKHLKTVTEHFVKNQATIKLDAAPMGYTPPKVCGSKLYGETEARFKDLNRAIQLIAHSPRTKFSCFDFPLTHLLQTLAVHSMAELVHRNRNWVVPRARDLSCGARRIRPVAVKYFSRRTNGPVALGVSKDDVDAHSATPLAPIR